MMSIETELPPGVIADKKFPCLGTVKNGLCATFVL